jgi:3-methyl-2-oxobutanoate hydroxymethyltransferase
MSAMATAESAFEAKKIKGKREKRTITEVRESKRTGEKMAHMPVSHHSSARWAEMAGVNVAVLGDSLAMIAHGHRTAIPAAIDMMVVHGQAVRGRAKRRQI